MTGRRWDVFVSYCHRDGEWARVLASNLHRDGFDVFLDIWEVVGGDRVTGRLEEGIRNSRSGVLICSREAMSRPWVVEEYEALLRESVHDPHRRLVPVLLEDAELPPFLANRAWVDFRTATSGSLYDAAFAELVQNLRGRPGAEPPDRGSGRQWPAQIEASVRPAGPIVLALRISRDQVTLSGGGEEVSKQPRGLRGATREAVLELTRLRSGRDPVGPAAYRGTAGPTLDGVLADVGRRLTADFVGGPVGRALVRRVAQAEALGERLELGLELEAELSDLPWETLVLPGPDGAAPDAGGAPLVLHHHVALYRAVPGLGPTPAYKVRGPLRVVVAIGSPESQDHEGELLNYEAELARIVSSLEGARRGGGAHVRVLHRGTLSAIRRALAEDPEGFHVLHLSCHAGPGELVLEDEDGHEDRVSAKRLIEEGVPAGTDLPLVVLAGCATGLRGRGRAGATSDAEGALISVAEALARRGVPQVLAMQAPVSDPYAIELAGELYGWLATAAETDPLVALAEARRACERRRVALPETSPRRGEPEWATPTLLVRPPRLPLYNPNEPFGPVVAEPEPALDEGLVVRRLGEFVGRRRQEREARRALASTRAGMVIHGLGGVGKSTLAAELVRSVGSATVVASKTGPLGVDTLLDEVGSRLARAALDGRRRVEALPDAQALRRSETEWSERWPLLAQSLAAVPLLVLLDNFEDNLGFDGGVWTVRDPELGALLSRWARHPGRSKLLFTCRHPFTLPEDAQHRLAALHLGPLSPAETAKLIWQLPGLDALTREEQKRAYQDAGGHPRTLEYLDALLRGGQARFEDVAERMERQLARRGIPDPHAWLASELRSFDASLAEAVTLAVDDVVLGELLGEVGRTPLGRELVVGASVYRHPVGTTALAWQVGREVGLPPDPARQARMQGTTEALQAALARGESKPFESLGLSTGELGQFHSDVAAETRPPIEAPPGFDAAIAAAASAGLLSSVPVSSGSHLWIVHRWTARAIAEIEPASVEAAHRKASRFWQWATDDLAQSPQESLEYRIEARFHHHAAGDVEAAWALTLPIIDRLFTRCHYGRAAELCRETLSWVAEGSVEAGDLQGRLASLAHLRGDFANAERGYQQAARTMEQLGDESGAAASYANLAILAQTQWDYEAAEDGYRRAIAIQERVGDLFNAAANHHNLGNLAMDRGDPREAEACYRRGLEIDERLGNLQGVAETYHQLGQLALTRGDYDDAEASLRRSLGMNERLGNLGVVATNQYYLGVLDAARGDYEAAEARLRESLDISSGLNRLVDVAAAYAGLAQLHSATGDIEGAVALNVKALAIQLDLGLPGSADNLAGLRDLRNRMSPDRFRAVLDALDAESRGKVLKMLGENSS